MPFSSICLSDSFCYGKSVRQFHEIRTQRGPQEDPNTHSYVLGQYPAAAAESPDSEHLQDSQRTSHIQPGAVEVVHTNTQVGLGSSGLSDVLSAESDIELEEDSDSGKRYLVQHWTGGTSCDMTGLERRVEVQVCSSRNKFMSRAISASCFSSSYSSIATHSRTIG